MPSDKLTELGVRKAKPRLHDFLLPSGARVTRDLISVDALEWELEGKRSGA